MMHKLKLIHWFFVWLGAMILLVILTQPDHRPDKLDKEGYGTTRSSVMYFQNIRSFYYLKSEEAGGLLDAYRLKSLYETPEEAGIPFVIYHNPQSKEAFIRVDTAFVFDRFTILQIDMDTMKMNVPFPGADQESQYVFGKLVYRVLRDDGALFLRDESGNQIAISGQTKIQIKMTLTDYFKLIDKQ